MRREHRPYWLYALMSGYEAWYARQFLLPHFDAVGDGVEVLAPWNIFVYGPNITLGRNVQLRAAPRQHIALTSWSIPERDGRIHISDYAMIGPGVRIQASLDVQIGKGVMFASHVTVTDSDWHDLYDRNSAPGRAKPVILEDDCWLGDSAIVCKGVTVGRNSVVGAGAVVVKDIPANCIAAGNPARVVAELDPDRTVTGRHALFEEPDKLRNDYDALRRFIMKDNGFFGWLRYKMFPRQSD